MKSRSYWVFAALLCLPFFKIQSQTFLRNDASKLISGSEKVRLNESTKSLKHVVFNDNKQLKVSDKSSWLADVLKSSKNNSFKEIKSEKDAKGTIHTRYQVMYKGIPVEGEMYSIHSRNEKILSANGNYENRKDIAVTPKLSSSEAYQKALSFVGAQKYLESTNENPEQSGELTILPINETYVLTYKFDIYAEIPLKRQFVFVNATDGTILKTIDRIHVADVTGNARTMYNGTVNITTDSYSSYYRLREAGRGNGIETYNLNNSTTYTSAVDFYDTDNYWNDSTNYNLAANDAHYGAEATFDYYYNIFGRNSYDNNGAKILSYVHYSTGYVNAFWDGTRMTYGDGDGVTYLPLTPIEVVGHEITHAVTEHTANLVYSYESGALNESFSDIFGVSIEFYKHPLTANFLMGDAMSTTHTPFRSMQSPNDYGDPDTYMGLYWVTGSTDNGGVHTNSGVQNYWFYLLCEGGTGINDLGNSYNVSGIGIDKAAQIAYRNLTVYLTPSSDYEDARYYSIQSAIDLFGDCSEEVAAVQDAWYAVGLGTPYTFNVISKFSSSRANICSVPGTISLYNRSVRANSYLWNFGDGSTDTTLNPTHTYTTAGNYNITLISYGSTLCNTSDTASLSVNVSSGNAPTQINCIPKTVNPGNGGILSFKLNNINRTTNGATDNYKDFTCTDTTSLKEGKQYIFNIKVGNDNPENVYIWVDLNNDGILDGTTELLYKKSKITKTLTDSIIVPGGAVQNTAIRLRVASDFSAGDSIKNPCSNPYRGQVQDYTVFIKLNQSAPKASFTSNSKEVLTGDTVIFSDNSLNLPDTWNWYFTGGSPSKSFLKNPAIRYKNPGTYTVKLVVKNNYGSDSIVKTDVIKVTTSAPSGLTAKVVDKTSGYVQLKWNKLKKESTIDDFEDGTSGNWVPLNGNWSVANGTYNVASSSSYLINSSSKPNTLSSFSYEVNMRKTAGGDYNIGLYFNGSHPSYSVNGEWPNTYVIMIGADGYWCFYRYINGSISTIVSWTLTSSINTGLGNWNKIKVVYANGYIDVYINDIKQGTYYDTTFTSGDVGLKMYDNSFAGIAEFDNISLSPISSNYRFGEVITSQEYFNTEGVNPEEKIETAKLKKFTQVINPQFGTQYTYTAQAADSSNIFRHFKIYRNSVLIDTTQQITYTDTLPKYGNYDYYVTARYDSLETEATNTSSVSWFAPYPGDYCDNAQNLQDIANPYSGSTFGYFPDFNFCTMGTAPDRIFYIDVPSQYGLNIGQTFNDFDSKYAIRVGGSCPGTTEIACVDEPDIQTHTYVNTSNSTQRVYFILSGVGSAYGNFTIAWKLNAPQKPVANLTTTATSVIKTGTIVSFSDKSTGVPNEWHWTFPGGNPETSTLQNPTVIYNTQGEFDVKLQVKNSVGTDSIVKSKLINVSNLLYCTTNLGGSGTCPGDITFVGISGTTLNNSNHNACTTANGSTYANYPKSGSTTAIIKADTSYTFNVTTSYSDIISIWIDYNQNSVFEPNEWTQVTTMSTSGVASLVKINIPSSALNGITGMRIRSRSYGNSNGSSDACSIFGSGITEDYIITIVNTPRKPVADFTGEQYALINTNVQYTDNSSGGPTSWKWYFEGGTPATSALTNPVVKYATAGTYDVKLVVSNSLGKDSITKTDYITVSTSLPGEDCNSAQNLSNLSSPYSATTTGYKNDFNVCSIYSPDRIFYMDVPNGSTFRIKQSYNDFDSRHTLRVGGTCPGTTSITCYDDPDEAENVYTNTSGATQRAYFIVAGYSSTSYGNFTLEWKLETPGIPVAEFTQSDTVAQIGSYIYFYDQSTGIPTSWRWSFPGATYTSSTSQNPSTYYNTPGFYDVQLIASNSYGADTILKKKAVHITLPPKPVAYFYASSTNVYKGNYTYFYDQSSNNPTLRKWTFSGGTPSTLTTTSSSASVYYNTPGIYDVKLVVSNSGGSDSLVRTGYIIVTLPPKPVANFYGTPTSLITGNYVEYYDNSTNSPTTRKWTFPGGSPNNLTTTSSYAYVYYYTPGVYDAKLVVSNNGGSDSLTRTNYITVTSPPKPVANFSSTNSNIVAGDYVYFSSTSTNSPTSYKWTFTGGSPATSTSSYSYVYYYTPGVYDVKLVATNGGGSDSIIKTGYVIVTAQPKPVANFSASPNSILVGNYVYYYDNSTNNPTTRKWEFPGGSPSTSTSSYAYVYYYSAGVYDAKLVVSNSGGSDSLVKTGVVTVTMPPKPVANFAASSTTLNTGSSIYFNNYSTNNPTSYKWTFAGGSPSTSTYTSPSVTYNTTGKYAVKLVATNAGGSDSLIRNDYIVVNALSKPVANFYSNVTNITAGSYVYFYDISSNSPTTIRWDFTGASPSSTYGSNVSAYYANPGSYKVKLTVTNSAGTDSLVRNGYITVAAPPKPIADFYASSTVGNTGSYIYFYNNSSNSPTSWNWSFPGGSPSTSTSSSVGVYYYNYGTYDVKLVVKNAGGADSLIKTGYINISRYCNSSLGGGGCPGYLNAVSIKNTTLYNNNHSICNNSYSSFPMSGSTTAELKAGRTYELSVTSSANEIISAWVDYNSNGYFESNEWAQVCTTSVSNIPNKINITVPANAVVGKTGLRIRSRSAGNSNGSGDACSSFGSGVTEDYWITISDTTRNFKADTTLICKNQSVTFTNLSTVTVSTYSWTFGQGAVPASASTAGPHTVKYTSSGYKTVFLVLNTNDTIRKENYIEVKELPATPVVTQSSNKLYSNVTFGNQWYNNVSGIITGEVSNIFAPKANGNYYTIVTNAGCSSAKSNVYNFVLTFSQDVESGKEVDVFPNPFSDVLNIKLQKNITLQQVQILNTLGKCIFDNENININESYPITLDKLSNGYYTVKVKTDKGTYSFKVLKIN